MKLISIFVFALFPVTVSGIADFLDGKKYNSVTSRVTGIANVEYYIPGYSDNFAETIKRIKEKPSDYLLIDDSFIDQEKIFTFMDNISTHIGHSKIIIYTGSNNHKYLNSLVKFGISNVLHKKMKREEFIDAMYLISESGRYLSKRILHIIEMGKMLGGISLDDKTNPAAAGLSKREKEILDLFCCGMNNQEIAEQLFISKRTVEKHCDRITNKLGLKSRRELIRLVLKNNDI